MTRLISIVGPTGTGKSDLGLAIAGALSEEGQAAEIVNTDSMQFYRGINIGTAKLAEDERGGVTHHHLSLDGFHPRVFAVRGLHRRLAPMGLLLRGQRVDESCVDFFHPRTPFRLGLRLGLESELSDLDEEQR